VYGINEIIVSVALILILVFRPRGFFGSEEPAFFKRIMAIRTASWRTDV
jgi:ABC-type branched-subunit amino acid transport system permease subunit